MKDLQYEEGYKDGKGEGFELGLTFGANAMFDTVYNALKDQINVDILTNIRKNFFDSVESDTNDETVGDFTNDNEHEEFGELETAYDLFERYLVLDENSGTFVLANDAPESARIAKERFENILSIDE